MSSVGTRCSMAARDEVASEAQDAEEELFGVGTGGEEVAVGAGGGEGDGVIGGPNAAGGGNFNVVAAGVGAGGGGIVGQGGVGGTAAIWAAADAMEDPNQLPQLEQRKRLLQQERRELAKAIKAEERKRAPSFCRGATQWPSSCVCKVAPRHRMMI